MMKSKYLLRYFSVLVMLFCLICLPAGAEICINEFMTMNASTIMDEDDDFSDWIEIFNPGSEAVDLTGYGLSDGGEPFEWVFPSISLPPGKPLLVFADGKDRLIYAHHWETVINRGDLWRFRVNDSAPPFNWRETGFDDSAWSTGPTGIGYGDNDDATVVPPCISCCLRKTITIDDPDNIRCLAFHVDFDDAFVAYINGVEIARANITTTGPPAWNQGADEGVEPLIISWFPPLMFSQDIPPSLLVQGENVVSISVHNTSSGSSDMTIIPWLTLGMNEEPPGAAGPANYIKDSLPNLHTSFSLEPEGEQIALTHPTDGQVDLTGMVEMHSDVSRGRNPNGGSTWSYQEPATPGESNENNGCPVFSQSPVINPPGGLHSESQLRVEITAAPEALITYTIDGSIPVATSTPYLEAIQLTEPTVVRAVAFDAGLCPSAVISQSYIVADPTTLPIASLVTDPANLWDPQTGIYNSPNYDFIEERPMHVEFYESDGALGFDVEAGFRMSGRGSRTYPQKSMAIFLRGKYGPETIDYQVFDEKDIAQFKQLVFRNGGQDWCRGMMCDGLAHRIVACTGLDRIAYRPARYYLNGEYWGLMNVREKAGKHYLAENHGIDPEEIDLLKEKMVVEAGTTDHYEAMLYYLDTHDISIPGNYTYINTMMDCENFATYMIFEIYFANKDWPHQNIWFWRPRTPAGRWQWIFQDLDLSMNDWDHNTLEFALEPDGPSWPNPPWSTFLFRSMMTNADFQQYFVNSFADHLNSTLLASRTLAIKNELCDAIAPEIERHMERWDGEMSSWLYYANSHYEYFFSTRGDYVREDICEHFSLPGDYTLSLDISPHGSGEIQLTAIEVDSTWTGTYFKTYQMPLTAVPRPGYQFDHWSDPSLPANPHVLIEPTTDYMLTAHFTEDCSLDTLVVINEINYNSHDDHETGDWLELYNYGSSTVDLSGWIIKDDNNSHSFEFPAGTYLESTHYLVVCENRGQFQTHFPSVENLYGNMSFAFSGGGELIRLYDVSGALYDYVLYDDAAPWPSEPDGDGPTLELVTPTVDNTAPENWRASDGYGSPGEMNSVSYSAIPETDPVTSLRLGRPFPNPSSGDTNISFDLNESGKVKLAVFDVTGRCVANLIDKELPRGRYHFTWQEASAAEARLSPGLYFIRLQTQNRTLSRRILLVK